ncbi:hypothetical protein [Methylocaldum sp.]|uniref:hypothetical protein n=1 Tax=Methylocaldum sp. TaxID=1969727 RepID=UPI002D3A82D8|nr:hypothetical protein [Methylocaldum sp.]HYE34793.1 hypothetical protein [Methylocaldum sp.]
MNIEFLGFLILGLCQWHRSEVDISIGSERGRLLLSAFNSVVLVSTRELTMRTEMEKAEGKQ